MVAQLLTRAADILLIVTSRALRAMQLTKNRNLQEIQNHGDGDCREKHADHQEVLVWQCRRSTTLRRLARLKVDRPLDQFGGLD
jgi:hypothetical protein